MGEAPQYLQDLLVEQPCYRQGLRSNNMYRSLIVPKTTRKTFADRSFSVAGPRQWNNLPDYVKRSNSNSKINLKCTCLEEHLMNNLHVLLVIFNYA